MHIVFDHQSFTRQGHGGVSRSFVELAGALNQLDDVTAEIFAPLHWNEYLAKPVAAKYSKGFYQRHGVFKLWHQRWQLNHYLTGLRCRFAPPEILHETWYDERFVGLPTHTKRATTVHDLIYQKHPEWTPDADERSRQLAASLDRADIIFCVSQHTKDDLLHWMPRLQSKPVYVIHLGVRESMAPETKGGIRDPRNGRSTELSPRPFLLYVGQRSSPNKNFLELARAFAASGLAKDTSLLCFGGGAFTDAEMGLFRELGLQEHQIIQQSGDDAALAAAYSGALALVYPSLYEGFGLPLLEAMVHNCPVASSDASCLPEIGGDACLYFNPKDIEQMADALRRICHDSTLRNTLIQKGVERSRLFTWEKSARAALAAYQSVL
jgi:glycosyltransferase involved in cell wall biosynthesis